jgi:hypothetical protein
MLAEIIEFAVQYKMWLFALAPIVVVIVVMKIIG